MTTQEQGARCTICGEGQRPFGYTVTPLGWQSVGVDTVAHAACVARSVSARWWGELFATVASAGLDTRTIREIPNWYDRHPDATPWALVSSSIGDIRIGRRHFVIEVGWAAGPDGRELFADEDVTAGERFVHARGWEKVTEYLIALDPRSIGVAFIRSYGGLRHDKVIAAFDRLSGEPGR